jgi:hypothetical protein
MFCSAQMLDLQKKLFVTLFTRLLLIFDLYIYIYIYRSQNVKPIQISNPNLKAIQILNHKPI